MDLTAITAEVAQDKVDVQTATAALDAANAKLAQDEATLAYDSILNYIGNLTPDTLAKLNNDLLNSGIKIQLVTTP